MRENLEDDIIRYAGYMLNKSDTILNQAKNTFEHGIKIMEKVGGEILAHSSTLSKICDEVIEYRDIYNQNPKKG